MGSDTIIGTPPPPAISCWRPATGSALAVEHHAVPLVAILIGERPGLSSPDSLPPPTRPQRCRTQLHPTAVRANLA
jgi:hypothetical protein